MLGQRHRRWPNIKPTLDQRNWPAVHTSACFTPFSLSHLDDGPDEVLMMTGSWKQANYRSDLMKDLWYLKGLAHHLDSVTIVTNQELSGE